MDTELLIIDDESEILIEVDTGVEVLEAAAQGPRGPQGIPGPVGGATTVMVGAAPISGHTAVALDSDGLLVYADCTNPAHIGAVQGVVGNAYIKEFERQNYPSEYRTGTPTFESRTKRN